MAILVDSAVFIDLIRKKVDPRQVLMPYLRTCEIYNCGVVRAEVLRGTTDLKFKAELQAFFDIIPEVPCDARLWRHVSDLGWALGRKGKWPPISDIVIAASAMRVGATLVSPDKHFLDIEGLKLRASL